MRARSPTRPGPKSSQHTTASSQATNVKLPVHVSASFQHVIHTNSHGDQRGAPISRTFDTRNLFVCFEIKARKRTFRSLWYVTLEPIWYVWPLREWNETVKPLSGFLHDDRKCERLVIWGNSVSLNSFIGPFWSNSAENTHLRRISFWKVQVGFLHFINTQLMNSAVVSACFAEHHYILCLCSCLSQRGTWRCFIQGFCGRNAHM